MNNTWKWFALLIALGVVTYLFINRKEIFGGSASTTGTSSSGKVATPTTSQPASMPAFQILTRLRKDDQSKVTLIEYRSDNGLIVESRQLSYQEALNFLFTSDNICLQPPKGIGANGYSECGRRR